jgi:hypothetical protein
VSKLQAKLDVEETATREQRRCRGPFHRANARSLFPAFAGQESIVPLPHKAGRDQTTATHWISIIIPGWAKPATVIAALAGKSLPNISVRSSVMRVV